jgi:hypothetical protein
VLITVSFLHIVPKSFEMTRLAPAFFLAGFLAFYLINYFLNPYLSPAYECPDSTLSVIPVVGIGFHSFLDGIIYSVTFSVSVFTGILAAIGMILHEFRGEDCRLSVAPARRIQPPEICALCLHGCGLVNPDGRACILPNDSDDQRPAPRNSVSNFWRGPHLRWGISLAARSGKRKKPPRSGGVLRWSSGRSYHGGYGCLEHQIPDDARDCPVFFQHLDPQPGPRSIRDPESDGTRRIPRCLPGFRRARAQQRLHQHHGFKEEVYELRGDEGKKFDLS